MIKNRRVCLITPFPPTTAGSWGGIHTHSDMLIRLLLKAGQRVTVIAPEQQGVKAAAGCDLILMQAGNRDFLTPRWFEALNEAFSAALEKGRPDHIFSESYYALGLGEAAAGIPVTAFVHNFHLIHFHKLVSEVEGPRSLAYYFLLMVPHLFSRIFRYELPFLKRASKVVSVSRHNAELLKKVYRLPAEKVCVLQNWVETEEFSPSPESRAAVREKMGLPESTVVFLCVGALWRPKGFQFAIEAFKRVIKNNPEAMLLLAGCGPYEERLKQAAGKVLPSGRIRFLGEIPRAELPALYNAADVFIIPSIHPEGLAYTLIEALSSGLPSIATALGGNIESIGDAGILAPPRNAEKLAEAMSNLAADRGLRERLAGSARKRALELFSEEAAMKKIEVLLG